MSTSPCSFIWYELMTPDADAAAKFYGAVLGWRIGNRADASPDGKDYRMIVRSDGGAAGGVMQLTAQMLQHGAHPTWMGYLHVKDVDAAATAITADGGKLLMPRMDLPVGSIAMVADPLGAPFYIMKPIPPAGNPDARSDVFDTDASQRVRWNELSSPDPERAKAFYGRHFGFAFNESMPMGDLGDYSFITDGAIPRIGAIMRKQVQAPGGWLFYFGVDSVVATKRAVENGGGTVIMGPHEVPGNLWIIVAMDPQGACFGVVGPKGENT